LDLTASFLAHTTAALVKPVQPKFLKKAKEQMSRFHRNVPKNSSAQAIPRKIMTVKSFGVGAGTMWSIFSRK
jgi:hypothetical protein